MHYTHLWSLISILLLISCVLGLHKPIPYEGCPIFDLKNRLSIIEKSTISSFSLQVNISAVRLFTDKEFILNLIRLHIPEEEFCELQSSSNFMMMFPAAIWLPEKHMFLTVVRLSYFIKTVQKSFLYTSFFDSDWKEVITEEMVGVTLVPGIIPIDVFDYNIENSGPEDPRIFLFSNEIYIIFNMIDIDMKRKMFLYNFSTGEAWPLRILDHSWWYNYAEKNWTPLIVDNKSMYFVYNYKHFQILDCTDRSSFCKKSSKEFNTVPSGLRGGSPYVRFQKTNYFVSFGYSHIDYRKNEDICVVYRPALTIVFIEENPVSFRLIYQSEPIEFQEKLFIQPIMNYTLGSQAEICGDRRIMMAVSIASWDYTEDVVDATINLNDTIPLAIKISGLTDLVNDVIKMHENRVFLEVPNCAEKLAWKHFDIEFAEGTKFSPRKKRMNAMNKDSKDLDLTKVVFQNLQV